MLTEVEIALAELDETRKLEQREDRGVDDAKLITLPRLEGGGDFFVHEPDPARFATLINAIDDAAGPPSPDVSRSKQRADGLQKMAAAWLGGGNAKPAKPLLLVRLDLADIVTNTAGRIFLNTRGDNHHDRRHGCRVHTLRHRYGWKLKVDANTGEVVARRRGRTFRSLPRGTPLSRPRRTRRDVLRRRRRPPAVLNPPA